MTCLNPTDYSGFSHQCSRWHQTCTLPNPHCVRTRPKLQPFLLHHYLRQISVRDWCWEDALQPIVQNFKQVEKAFPPAGCGKTCILQAIFLYATNSYMYLNVTRPRRTLVQSWNSAVGSEVKWNAALTYHRSVVALEHNGVPFSPINLPIFHGCGGLFIEQWMIKWRSAEGPSSFSFSPHPFPFVISSLSPGSPSPLSSLSSPLLGILVFLINSILYSKLLSCQYNYIKLRGRDKSFNSISILVSDKRIYAHVNCSDVK